jgi:hypothetical protein
MTDNAEKYQGKSKRRLDQENPTQESKVAAGLKLIEYGAMEVIRKDITQILADISFDVLLLPAEETNILFLFSDECEGSEEKGAAAERRRRYSDLHLVEHRVGVLEALRHESGYEDWITLEERGIIADHVAG